MARTKKETWVGKYKYADDISANIYGKNMANINTLMIYLATLGVNPGLEPGRQVSNINEHK